jgi:rare lipoprotein A
MRLPLFRSRARVPFLVGMVTAALVLPTAASHAQTPAQPVIESAPRKVGYQRPARIVGRLDGGQPGEEVALERRREGGEWTQIAVQTTDAEGRVRFRLDSLEKTRYYRLAWTDEISFASTYSEERKIRVRPRLVLRASRLDVMQGRGLRLRGRLLPASAGRHIALQRRVEGSWHTFARPYAGDGDFSVRSKFYRAGWRRVRTVFRGDATNTASKDGLFIRVYRRSEATWYGPGFYGQRTACGKTLTGETLGVAHRTLPCGTEINLLYEGRTITVRVIDRGPYGTADWDLTQETAERLRFSGRDRIGVIRAG